MDFDLQMFDFTVKDVLKDVLKSKISGNENLYTEKNQSFTCGVKTTSEDFEEESLSKENDELQVNAPSREEKRLRNRLAARKCREKRKQRILYLEKVCNSLENRMVCLQNEVSNLMKERDTLSSLLSTHWCVSKTQENQTHNYTGYNEVLFQPY